MTAVTQTIYDFFKSILVFIKSMISYESTYSTRHLVVHYLALIIGLLRGAFLFYKAFKYSPQSTVSQMEMNQNIIRAMANFKLMTPEQLQASMTQFDQSVEKGTDAIRALGDLADKADNGKSNV